MKKITVINTEIEIADVTTAAKSKVKVCNPESYALGYALDVKVKDRDMIANMLYYMHVALIAYNGRDAYYITSYSQFQEALTKNYPINVRYSTVVDRLREIKSNLTFHEMQEFGDFFLASMPASMKDMLVHMTGKGLLELYEKFEEDRRAKYPDFYRFKDFIVTSWNDPFNDFLTSMPTPEMMEDMYGVFTAYQKQLQNEEDDKKRAAEKEKDGTTDEAGELETEESCVIPEDVDREFIIRDLLKMNALLTAKDNEGETFFITDNALAIEAIRNRYQVSVRCPRLVEVVRGIRKKGADMVHFSMFVRKASKGRFVDLTAGELESLYNEFTKEVKASDAEPVTKDKDEACENEDEKYADTARALFCMNILLTARKGDGGTYYITDSSLLENAIAEHHQIIIRDPYLLAKVREISTEMTDVEMMDLGKFISKKMKNYGFNDLTVEALGFLYNEFKNR